MDFDSTKTDFFSIRLNRHKPKNSKNGPTQPILSPFYSKLRSFSVFYAKKFLLLAFGTTSAFKDIVKTIYLIKSFLPFIFLPIAPSVVQVELERQGMLSYATSPLFSILVQLVLTLGIITWLAIKAHRENKAKAFLRMSCVSKKVFHQDRWITVEQYLSEHHNVVVSHGMTPEESRAWIDEAEAYLRRERRLELAEKL
jgi:hypothetical protein